MSRNRIALCKKLPSSGIKIDQLRFLYRVLESIVHIKIWISTEIQIFIQTRLCLLESGLALGTCRRGCYSSAKSVSPSRKA